MREGNYTFSNDTLISAKKDRNYIRRLLKHEFVHKETIGNSTYGMLLVMMEKASIVDNSKMWLFNELLDLLNKMQERTATFIEYFDIISEEGIDEFNRKVEELKRNNKAYYKHFSFIYQYLKEEHFLKENLEDTINVVKAISILSSNVEIDKIPFGNWTDKKDMQRFFSDQTNILKFNPNKRFEALIKSEFDGSSKYYEQRERILENTYFGENILEICRIATNNIYKESDRLGIIRERITKFRMDTYDQKYLPQISALTAFPILYDKEVEHKFEVLGINDVLKKLKNDSCSILQFNHLLGGLEKISLLSCISFDESVLTVRTSQYNISGLISIINKVGNRNPIVFSQGKLYKMFKDILNQKLNSRKIYIFMENSFLSSLSFLSSEFTSSKYAYIALEEYDIVAISKQNIILIQLVVKGVSKEVKDALRDIDIQPANIAETMDIVNEEIKFIARTMFTLCIVAVNNKDYGFK